jgi:hypothetical protein
VLEDRKRQVLPGHARSVVRYLDEIDAASIQLHPDLPGPGVEGVVDEFAQGGGGPLDDLACGDQPGGFGRQDVDACHIAMIAIRAA